MWGSVLVYYTTSDRSIAPIDRSSGSVTPQRPGRVTFTATTPLWPMGWSNGTHCCSILGIPLQLEAGFYFQSQDTKPLTYNPPSVVVGVGGSGGFAGDGGEGTLRSFDNQVVDIVFGTNLGFSAGRMLWRRLVVVSCVFSVVVESNRPNNIAR